MRKVMMRASKLGSRLFRNHVGLAYQGKPYEVNGVPIMVKIYPGDVLVRQARKITCGFGVGSSDSLGWTPMIITPEMVGNKIAVFTAAEIKTDIGQPTDEQLHFIKVVQEAGGIAGIVRNEEDIEELLTSGSIG